MFRGKIFARSEVEIKLYFKQWKIDVEEKGYLDPEFYAEARKGEPCNAYEEIKGEEESMNDENKQEEILEQPLLCKKVEEAVEQLVEEGPKSSPMEIKQ